MTSPPKPLQPAVLYNLAKGGDKSHRVSEGFYCPFLISKKKEPPVNLRVIPLKMVGDKSSARTLTTGLLTYQCHGTSQPQDDSEVEAEGQPEFISPTPFITEHWM